MKISTKGRYALRLMLDLAMNGENNVVRIKDIAERQQISDKYLEQIISILNKAGYVRSTRGPQGGYSLRKAPELPVWRMREAVNVKRSALLWRCGSG